MPRSDNDIRSREKLVIKPLVQKRTVAMQCNTRDSIHVDVTRSLRQDGLLYHHSTATTTAREAHFDSTKGDLITQNRQRKYWRPTMPPAKRARKSSPISSNTSFVPASQLRNATTPPPKDAIDKNDVTPSTVATATTSPVNVRVAISQDLTSNYHDWTEDLVYWCLICKYTTGSPVK